MKIIKVKSCGKCPYKEEYNGGGFIEPYTQCGKYGMILEDEDIWMDLNKIHADCKLEDEK